MPSERNVGADPNKQMHTFTMLGADSSYMYIRSSASWHLILIPNNRTFARSQVVIRSCRQVNIEYRYCHSLNFQVGKLAENTL